MRDGMTNKALPQGDASRRELTDDELRWARVHIEADRRKPFAFVREVWR